MVRDLFSSAGCGRAGLDVGNLTNRYMRILRDMDRADSLSCNLDENACDF